MLFMKIIKISMSQFLDFNHDWNSLLICLCHKSLTFCLPKQSNKLVHFFPRQKLFTHLFLIKTYPRRILFTRTTLYFYCYMLNYHPPLSHTNNEMSMNKIASFMCENDIELVVIFVYFIDYVCFFSQGAVELLW